MYLRIRNRTRFQTSEVSSVAISNPMNFVFFVVDDNFEANCQYSVHQICECRSAFDSMGAREKSAYVVLYNTYSYYIPKQTIVSTSTNTNFIVSYRW